MVRTDRRTLLSEEVRSVLDDDAVTDAARRLLAAERSRQPIRQLSLQYPDMTVEDAYRVQRALATCAPSSTRSRTTPPTRAS
jgi:2-keto-4-pentenoate hydratase